jgi:hypothetical protein
MFAFHFNDDSQWVLTIFSVSDTAFPRKQTMEILLHVIRQQPKLSKEGSSALIDLGEVAHPSASRDELDVLLNGLLMQEVYVRNSCLQTLQVYPLFWPTPVNAILILLQAI